LTNLDISFGAYEPDYHNYCDWCTVFLLKWALRDTSLSDNAVLLQLPTFWISQPQVWFEKAEPQFHIRQISTDMTMF
ncbi:hypothetical protein T4D_6455, partial [Trichinella pseudospiralis]